MTRTDEMKRSGKKFQMRIWVWVDWGTTVEAVNTNPLKVFQFRSRVFASREANIDLRLYKLTQKSLYFWTGEQTLFDMFGKKQL